MTSEKILILGATGKLGSATTKKLIENKNNTITQFSRTTKTKIIDEDNLNVKTGDASKIEDIEEIINEYTTVICAIPGEKLPKIAENLTKTMKNNHLIFTGAVGIYNEIPDEIDGKDNVENNKSQIPNKDAVEIIEKSKLNYTILRPGYLREGNEDDYTITEKGEKAKGYITTIPSITKLITKIIENKEKYNKKSLSITRQYKE